MPRWKTGARRRGTGRWSGTGRRRPTSGPFRGSALDEACAVGGLLVLVREEGQEGLGPPGLDGLEALAQAAFVLADHGAGHVQDALVGTVVPLQADYLRPREDFRELQDIPHLGAAETVDGLVVVPHDADIGSSAGQDLEELELGDVGVLVLVDQDDAEALVETVAYRLVVPQDAGGQEDEVAEVHVARFPQAALVFCVQAAEIAVREPRLQVRGVGRQAVVLGPGYAGGQASALVTVEVRDKAAEQRDGIVVVVDGEVGIEPGRRRVAPQEPGSEGMEGPEEGARARRIDGGRAVAHLPGGLVGEGDGQDGFGGKAALPDQPGYLGRDDAGLAGARAGQDEEIAALVPNGVQLFGIELSQVFGKIGHGIEYGTGEGGM